MLFQLEGPVRTVIAGLNDASENLRKLGVLTDCHNIHKDYTYGIEAICSSALWVHCVGMWMSYL